MVLPVRKGWQARTLLCRRFAVFQQLKAPELHFSGYLWVIPFVMTLGLDLDIHRIGLVF